ncbi:endolytic transglycosylase MltG [Anaerosporobacter faecicola]|uniref:endolytic transglycosylase MltG n=1 Tax=Anaerosporobacter faecicola TaxID=2718714 RepID=UPI00143A6A42|nr:endolytic transglycosylase MltG [Anaerosporobacter faecicola]
MKIKLKYFIRGLGVGIVFTALIMSISLQNSRSRIRRESTLSKEEIIEKAISYGMVEANQEDNTSTDLSENPTDDTSVTNSKEEIVVQQDENTSDSEKSEDDKKEADPMENDNSTEDGSIDKESTEAGTQVTTEEDTTADKDKNSSVVTIDYIPIEITAGMTATSVSTMLKEKGIIEDADEFRTYMSEQGYSGKIHTGEYLIPVNATYKKIANIISK